MRNFLRHIFILSIVIRSSLPVSAFAQESLNELSLFYRCFSHLTQSRPVLSDPLLAQVKAGSKTALQACTEVLDKARFTANSGTKIQNDTDMIAKKVLSVFHHLHRSWAREKSIFYPPDYFLEPGTETWFEESPFGAYITRALFSPNYNVDSVTSGNDYLQAVRTNMNPPHSYKGIPSTVVNQETDFRLGTSQHPFAPLGELLGIAKISLPPISFFPSVRFTSLTSIPNFANIGVPPALTRSFTNINLTDITAVKGSLLETENFGIRIKGQLTVTTAGSYTIYLDVDDAAMLILDGNRIINRTGSGEGSAVTVLQAGIHNIEIHYRQQLSAARIILSWQGPNITKQVIPNTFLSGLTGEYYTETKPAPFSITGSEGGGFIGNHNYLMTTFLQSVPSFVPNGVVQTNRSWARAVLNDALCRDIPVVRESDISQFVIPNSTVPFRKASACVSCHASIDRQAGLIRGVRWNILEKVERVSPLPFLFGISSIKKMSPTYGPSSTWPDTPDPFYAERSPSGQLFFRNYRGELVDSQVQSIEDLATRIRAQDDYYICFAKRYYQYFTGISVNINDPGSSTYSAPNQAEAFHLNQIIELGLLLKNHKSLRQLVIDIMSLPQYRLVDYGVTKKS